MTTTSRSVTIKTGTFTIQNTKTGEHRTFRISRTRGTDAKFAAGERTIELLVGPNNCGDFRSFGFAKDDTVKVWKKKTGVDAPSAYDYYASMIASLMGGVDRMGRDWAAAGYRLQGEAKCCACGRKLTTPESLDAGIGPVCAAKSLSSMPF